MSVQKIINLKNITLQAVFLVSALSTVLFSSSSVSAYSGQGAGTGGDPYLIANCVQLQEMQDDLSASYTLANNIDCSDTSNWNDGAGFDPVGDCFGPGFAGSLNGNGHTISNLTINRSTTDRQALFGCTNDNAVIEKVGLVNVDITGQRYAGGIVGILIGANSVIRNSYVTGEVKLVYGEVMGSGQFAGGIVAGLDSGSQIINSYSAADVSTYYNDAWGEGGIAGYAYNSSTVTNSFWDTETPSTVLLSEGGGTGKTTVQMKTASTFTDAGWDFNNIWAIDSIRNDGYPILMPEGVNTQPLCEQSIATATTVRMACELTYSTEPNSEDVANTIWSNARYRIAGDTGWTNVEISDPNTGLMTFTGLDPSTDYQVSLKATNNLFDEWMIVEGATLSANSDVDSDGSPDVNENDGPNNGDANDDGTIDALQANVLSYINPLTNQAAVLEAVNCTSITGFQIGSEASDPADSQFNYPMGLASFHILCPNDGDTATIRQYFYGVEGNNSYSVRKWMNDGSYREIPGYSLLGVPIPGNGVVFFVEYQITDGGEFDDDGTLNGIIVDPSGPALAANSTSDNTSTQSSSDLAGTGQNATLITIMSAILVVCSTLAIKRKGNKI